MPLHQFVFLALLLSGCGYAIIRGGAPERITAAAQLAAVICTWIFARIASWSSAPYSSVEVGVAATDFTLFAIMAVLAFASTRFWPILQASMMGCELLGHLAKQLGPDILPRAYYAIVAFWSYPMIILLAVATWRHRVRLRHYGIDYAWIWQPRLAARRPTGG